MILDSTIDGYVIRSGSQLHLNVRCAAAVAQPAKHFDRGPAPFKEERRLNRRAIKLTDGGFLKLKMAAERTRSRSCLFYSGRLHRRGASPFVLNACHKIHLRRPRAQ